MERREGKIIAEVLGNEQLAEGIFDLRLAAPELCALAAPGQFVMVYPKNDAHLLPRPISICGAEDGVLRLVYRVVGTGTAEFAGYQPGETAEVMGPLGNGFSVAGGHALLFGGGIGIPPMLKLAKQLAAAGTKVTVILGYRNADIFLADEFRAYADVILATDDGSLAEQGAFHGNVVDAARARIQPSEISRIYACGPLPMLRGIKQYAADFGIPAEISMEERMACGIGVCLGCVCQSEEVDEHSHVKNKRVCKDGPVFMADEIVI